MSWDLKIQQGSNKGQGEQSEITDAHNWVVVGGDWKGGFLGVLGREAKCGMEIMCVRNHYE